MKKIFAFVAVAAFAAFAVAQIPPPPPSPILRPVRLSWDAQPASDYWNAVDTNGQPVAIVFRVWNATNILGPWAVAATTTNLTATISNLTARTQFFHVTASNFFWKVIPAGRLQSPWTRCPHCA